MTLDPIDSQTIANDFDHTQPSHSANWTETYAKLRGQCPHGWSNNHGGFWVATRYQDVMSVAQSPAFSSAKDYDPENGVLKGGNIIPPFPVQPVLPTEPRMKSGAGIARSSIGALPRPRPKSAARSPSRWRAR